VWAIVIIVFVVLIFVTLLVFVVFRKSLKRYLFPKEHEVIELV
jgi:hypothetical protein